MTNLSAWIGNVPVEWNAAHVAQMLIERHRLQPKMINLIRREYEGKQMDQRHM